MATSLDRQARENKGILSEFLEPYFQNCPLYSDGI